MCAQSTRFGFLRSRGHDGAALVEGWKMPKAGSETKQKEKPIGRNLRYEMDTYPGGPLDLPALHQILNERYEADFIDMTTLERYYKGLNNPEIRFRNAFASIFGYTDSRSIIQSDHIERRERMRNRIAPDAPEYDHAFIDLMTTISQAKSLSHESVLSTFNRLMGDPTRSPYTRIALVWIERLR